MLSMLAARLSLVLVLYVGLDFANPLMPGAMEFDVEDTVDGLRASRVQPDGARATLVAAPRADCLGPPLPRSQRAAVVRTAPVAALAPPPRHALPRGRSEPPPGDDA
jgi:hypothetical protein